MFLVCGQSNTEGRIPNSDLPAYLATNGRAQGDRTLEAGKAFFSITEGDEHARQSKLRFAIPAKLSSQVLPFAPQEEFSPQYDLDGYSRPEPAPDLFDLVRVMRMSVPVCPD